MRQKQNPKVKSKTRKPFTDLMKQKNPTAVRPTNIRGTKMAAYIKVEGASASAKQHKQSGFSQINKKI